MQTDFQEFCKFTENVIFFVNFEEWSSATFTIIYVYTCKNMYESGMCIVQ